MSQPRPDVEQWGIFEAALQGPSDGNPFMEVDFGATFRFQHRTIKVNGFYDGDGLYRVRFMPDVVGEWSYTTYSSRPELDGEAGTFLCVTPSASNHGPVRVRSTFHFAYADDTSYFPVGTTCYAWNHQGDALEEQTLQTLRQAPFNKLRMCVFPKHYAFSRNEPVYHPFEGQSPDNWDFTRFNPAFFRHLEQRIWDLMQLGIEADLILFHPYDRWGYSSMPFEVNERYLRYLVSRLWAYRNIWWSMANEYDLMKSKSMQDWDRFFQIVQEGDPAQHLRSIHNCMGFYDHRKPWVTHCSVQHSDLTQVATWREQYHKPVVVDECCYEGNIQRTWGNIPAAEMVKRFWEGFARGGYVGHGETYRHPEDILWWSKGGVLHGESPQRIAFLRKIWEEGPAKGVNPAGMNWNNTARVGQDPDYYLQYFGIHAPAVWELDLPEGKTYQADIIDTWEMTVSPAEGTFSGKTIIELPGKSYIALRLQAVQS